MQEVFYSMNMVKGIIFTFDSDSFFCGGISEQ